MVIDLQSDFRNENLHRLKAFVLPFGRNYVDVPISSIQMKLLGLVYVDLQELSKSDILYHVDH